MHDQTPPRRKTDRSVSAGSGVLITDVDRTGKERRRAGVRIAGRPVPARAAAALLPNARLAPGRRGPGPGDAVVRVARPRALSGARIAARVAVPDRDQPLPQHAA